MRILKYVYALGAAGVLSGCATITNDPNQPVQFVGLNCAEKSVKCTAKNKRGAWD